MDKYKPTSNFDLWQDDKIKPEAKDVLKTLLSVPGGMGIIGMQIGEEINKRMGFKDKKVICPKINNANNEPAYTVAFLEDVDAIRARDVIDKVMEELRSAGLITLEYTIKFYGDNEEENPNAR